MGIRRKVLLVLSGVAALLVVAVAVAVSVLFGRLTGELERQEMVKYTANVEREFAAQLDSMRATAFDYGHWNRTRDFLQGTNPAWTESNMQATGLVSLGMNGQVVYDLAGVPVASLLLDAEGEPFADPVANVLDPTKAAVLQVPEPGGVGGGFWLADDGTPVLIRSAAVTNDDVTEGPYGTIAFRRAMDEDLIAAVSEKLSLDVAVRVLPPDAGLPPPGEVAVQPLGSDTIEATTSLPLVNSDRTLALYVRDERSVAATAANAAWVVTVALVVIGVVVIALAVFLIDRFVLRRLERLSADVRRVAESADPAERVTVDGADEITQVAVDTNSMLSSIGRTQENLRTLTVDLARAKAAADTANESKSVFLSTMSHEIRTPINGVIGMLSIALTTELTDEQRDLLETARGSAESLTQLVGDYLDLSKIESGRLELDPRPFDLHDLVHAVTAEFRYQAELAGVTLTADVADGTPHDVVADDVRIRQVLVNLVGNALKFTPDGGAVTLQVAPTGDTPGGVRLAVVDDGPGIAPEHRATIFEAYDQAGAATARDHGGTGLGLAITRRIVEVMNGSIDVCSTPGDGTTFTVVLDLALQPSNVLSD